MIRKSRYFQAFIRQNLNLELNFYRSSTDYQNLNEYYKMQIEEDKRWVEFNKSFDKMNLFKIIYGFQDNKETMFSGFSIHGKNDTEQKLAENLFKNQDNFQKYIQNDPIQSKCIASILGNAIGDALGSHTEFSRFSPERDEIEYSWDSLKQWAYRNKKEQLVFGVVSDDFSMARCIADSFLSNQMQFNPIDLRIRFLLWWYTGYNNGSVNLPSFGLGGNIADGFSSFFRRMGPPYVVSNDKKRGNVSGNGSVMRLSPIPVRYYDDLQKAEDISVLHSLTTHNGDEAAEVCRLLTHLTVKLLNYEGGNAKKDVFDKLGESFKSECVSVQFLANSEGEPMENLKLYDRSYNWSKKDRFWDWKDPVLQPSPCRLMNKPTYFGSYVMDACYLALHICYHTNSFEEAVFKAVNWGGDSDSFGGIVGYLCGAMYGLDEGMLKLYEEQMVQHDQYTSIVKAIKLYQRKPIDTQAFYKVKKGEPLL